MRYNLPPELTTESKEKAERRETCTVTIYLLELLGMVVTAWVMLELVGDRPESVRDPIALRGENVSAVMWVNKCGGAKDKRACLRMKMLRSLEMKGGWSRVPKHTPGVENNLADGISRWPRAKLAEEVQGS